MREATPEEIARMKNPELWNEVFMETYKSRVGGDAERAVWTAAKMADLALKEWSARFA